MQHDVDDANNNANNNPDNGLLQRTSSASCVNVLVGKTAILESTPDETVQEILSSLDLDQSDGEATSNLIKSFVGAGILALPAAIGSTGVVGGSMMIVAIGWASFYCVILLIRSVHQINREGALYRNIHNHPDDNDNDDDAAAERERLVGGDDPRPARPQKVRSFADVGEAAYGQQGRLVANLILMVSQVGFCTAYISFISTNLTDIMPSVSKVVWVLILVPILQMLSLIRSFKLIAPYSKMGNILFAISLICFFIHGFMYDCCIPSKQVAWFRPSGLPVLFGTAAFALEGIGTIIPVEKRMVNRGHFMAILESVMIGVIVLYLFFGITGYLFYGEHTESVITVNLGHGILATCVKLSLCLCLVVSYVVNLFPVSEYVDFIIAERLEVTVLLSATPFAPPIRVESSHDEERRVQTYWTVTTAVRLVLVIVTAMAAILIRDFGHVVSLVGSLSNGSLAFMLPAIFYLRICRPSGGYTFRFVALPVLVSILGVVASVAGVSYTLMDMAKHKKV